MDAEGTVLVDPAPRLDPRALRTRSRLQQALLDLATHRDLDEISVAELTTAAEVNRATFYLHYTDKDAVLLDATSVLMAETAAGAAAMPPTEADDPDRPPRHTIDFFRSLDRHALLYRRILGPSGSPAVVANLRVGLETAIAVELERRTPAHLPKGLTSEIFAAYLAGAVLGAATAWLRQDVRRSPDEMAAALWPLITAAASALPHEQPPNGTR